MCAKRKLTYLMGKVKLQHRLACYRNYTKTWEVHQTYTTDGTWKHGRYITHLLQVVHENMGYTSHILQVVYENMGGTSHIYCRWYMKTWEVHIHILQVEHENMGGTSHIHYRGKTYNINYSRFAIVEITLENKLAFFTVVVVIITQNKLKQILFVYNSY